MIAEKLGRTVEELLYGSPAHVPLSEYELYEWSAHFQLTRAEQEEANRTAGS